MFRTILLSAAGAGVAACLAVSVLQAVTTTPLILHAETFESDAPAGGHDHAAAPAAAGEEAVAPHDHDAAGWAPADGVERTLYTALANLVVGVGVALVLLAGMSLRGGRIDARTGLLWGVAGFFAVSLLPALGLPPELPGTPAADLVSRQLWWLLAAAASAGGIAILLFGPNHLWRAGGLALILIPHLVGAPTPPGLEAGYPAVLSGEFVMASLTVSALLWGTAGFAAGWLHRRLTASA
jgi:cobalt transporter subunit CbtA